MQKEIFINESMGETRIAIQESNQLVEVYVEKQDNHRMVGNVYKGVVENVLPGMQAAFVDIGYDLNAFLPFSEIGSDEFIVEEDDNKSSKNNKNSKYDNIEVDLKKDQEIYVQVIKEPFAGKGPRVTTEVALPGRLLVLVPNANYIGISKKIWDKYERRRLKKIAQRLRENDLGVIIRTVAEGKSEEHIENDFNQLVDNWNKIEEISNRENAPVIVYEDLETASTVVRDLLHQTLKRLLLTLSDYLKKLNAI